MKQIDVCKQKELWNKTLPVLSNPFQGESLIGYLFRLAFINGLSPNAIIKEVLPEKYLRYNSDPYKIAEIESNIDISKVTEITGITQDYINNISVNGIRKKLYKYNNRHTKNAFKISLMKFCPICIKEWKIPVLFLFNEVNTCLIHGAKLIYKCRCKRTTDLFKVSQPLKCSNKKCSASYRESYQKQDYGIIKNQSFVQSIFTNFINEDINLVNKNEKIVKSLFRKMIFLQKFKYEDINHIQNFFSFYMDIKMPIPYQNYRWHNILKFSEIISKMEEFRFTAYEFSTLKVPEVENFQCKILNVAIDGEKELFSNYKQIDSICILEKFNYLVMQLDLFEKHKIDYPHKSYLYNQFSYGIKIKGKIKVVCNEITVFYEFELVPHVYYGLKRVHTLKI
ncbi:TniQ protein [Natronincola peptidivorans]|uniref:TniQ protein n=1 Tax=Natronincola peptidivorans TaxID=426128 RepID=A0A1I0FUA1_9FIRM|nr:TniQ family protein [Natronincola peptidivorans]SET61980.1 TniQ protein [Natronincola peptidivorans]